MSKLHDNIRFLRKQKQMSQEELARLTGFTDRSSIAKIEKGDVDLTETKIVTFARALGVTPQELVGWEAIDIRPLFIVDAEETSLVEAYRTASDDTKLAIRRILNI